MPVFFPQGKSVMFLKGTCIPCPVQQLHYILIELIWKPKLGGNKRAYLKEELDQPLAYKIYMMSIYFLVMLKVLYRIGP